GGIRFSSKRTASCAKNESPALRFFASKRTGAGRSPPFPKWAIEFADRRHYADVQRASFN
ncbi:hypothetical protein, partial [Lysobacter sp. Root690]|uniref:hypothetical protein n=1 Tax=Lysobacter sp. Root690 TaxID=1736588 RepID=UPI001F3A315C